MSTVAMGHPADREVGFVEALRLGFSNYVRFTGRSSRGAYWFWVVWMLIGAVVTGALDSVLFGSSPSEGSVLNGLWALATLLPSLANSVRRLHDIGRSGWWVLIVLVPVIGFIILIYWHAQPGQRAENRFGPDAEAGRD